MTKKRKYSYIKQFLKEIESSCGNHDLESTLWSDEECIKWNMCEELYEYVDKVKSIKYNSYDDFVDQVNVIFDKASLPLKNILEESLIQSGEQKYWLLKEAKSDIKKQTNKTEILDIREWDPDFHG